MKWHADKIWEKQQRRINERVVEPAGKGMQSRMSQHSLLGDFLFIVVLMVFIYYEFINKLFIHSNHFLFISYLYYFLSIFTPYIHFYSDLVLFGFWLFHFCFSSRNWQLFFSVRRTYCWFYLYYFIPTISFLDSMASLVRYSVLNQFKLTTCYF